MLSSGSAAGVVGVVLRLRRQRASQCASEVLGVLLRLWSRLPPGTEVVCVVLRLRKPHTFASDEVLVVLACELPPADVLDLALYRLTSIRLLATDPTMLFQDQTSQI